METAAERYRRLRTAFADKISRVPDERWGDPSPCEDWTARELVGHVVGTQAMFEQLVGRTLEPGPDVDADPLGAFVAATDQVQAHLDDPETAAVEFDGVFGRSTFATAVDGFLSFDLVVHGWDLARATGLDEHIDDNDVAWVRESTERLGDMLRSNGVCDPPVEVGDDASEQDKLLGFLGRRP